MNEEYFNEHVGDLKSFYNTSFENIKELLKNIEEKEVFYLIEKIDTSKPYKITLFEDKTNKENIIAYITESNFTFGG